MSEDNAKGQAQLQMQRIVELVEHLNNADDEIRDVAAEAIYTDPLSVEVRSGWVTVDAPMDYDEFRILLCTGGPAVQIVGRLDEYNMPHWVRLEYQDWFTEWTPLLTTEDERQALLTYCQQFYFGD